MTSEKCDLSTASVLEGFSVRINNISSAECLEKASFDVHNSPNKVFESHIPRSSLAVSNSCNDALKSDLRRHKGRPSMIPKSKSIKRTEKDNVKVELSVKTEEVSTSGKSIKNQSTNKGEAREVESKKNLLEIPKEGSPPKNTEQEPKKENEVSFTSSAEEFHSIDDERLEADTSTTSVKSCVTAIERKEDGLENSRNSTTSVKSQLSEYKDAEEDLNNCSLSHEIFEEETPVEEKETEKQERRIQTLYETLKSTGPMFDNFKWRSENTKQENLSKEGQNFSVQKCYNTTLQEISDIWKNTMSLISSVKKHATLFVEEKGDANPLDREQLILEGEMVQLAIDFSVNYSKLKTEFLIKSLSERLGVENSTKTGLEEFMDSKTFTALYNDDDLATMSRTIKDLNASVLKEEDAQVE